MEKRAKLRNALVIVVILIALLVTVAITIYSLTYTIVTTNSLVELPNFSTVLDESSLIIHGKVDGKSNAFTVLHVNGESEEIYTDYYVTPIRVFRGKEAERDQVTVRLKGGGPIDRIYADYPQEAKLESGKEYLFILSVPITGGFATEGEYYYPRYQRFAVWNMGNNGEVYFESPHYLLDDSNIEKEKRVFEEQEVSIALVQVSEIERFVEEANMRSSYENADELIAEKHMKNMQMNLESGFISEEEYETMLKELTQYGTIIK